jgi:Nuclease-related domain
VRLVCVGGEDKRSCEQRLWLALAFLVGLAAGGILVAVETPGARPLWVGVGLAVVLIALRLGARITQRLRSVRRGRLGERLVVDLLRGLPDDYCLVNDVTLGLARGRIDHVLIGPCGVVVLETKRVAGTIRCRDDEWSINGDRLTNVSRRVNSGACAVRYFLAERHPELVFTALRWVESIIVFTHPLSRLEANQGQTIVVRYSHLFQVVLELAQKQRLEPAIAEQLVRTLVASQTPGTADAGRARLTAAS